MARTKAENFDDIKEHILVAAARLFSEQGFRSTNIIDIGQACSASKSRMYHYFPSKEVMLQVMLENHVSRLVELADQVSGATLTPQLKFRKYVHVHLHYYFEHRDRHKVLLEDADHMPTPARAALKRSEQKLVSNLSSILSELNPKRFKDQQVATTHAMLIYGMLNWTYTWYKPTGKIKLDTLVQQAGDLCLKGIL